MAEALHHALIHLTGVHRGSMRVLGEARLRIGTASGADLHFPSGREPAVAPFHAELLREEEGWILEAAPGEDVYVNGEPLSSGRVDPGDVIQLGSDGPLLRLRVQPASESEYKTLRDALSDCVACARYGADSAVGKAALALRSMPRELLTSTAPWVGVTAVGLLLLSVGMTAFLFVRSRSLDEQLASARGRLDAVAASLQAEERRTARITPGQLDSLRDAVVARVEARTAPEHEILARTSRSVMLIQGAYGFRDPRSGRLLRIEPITSEGRRRGTPERRLGADVDGPPLERRYTGTGFVVAPGGLVVTNRHLVEPWASDSLSRSLERAGYLPVLRRMVGYLPDHGEGLSLRIEAVSDSGDLALLRAKDLPAGVEPLPLARGTPRVGEDIYLLGYPTGVRALLARSDPGFVGSLRADSTLDFWSVARRLAGAGEIAPLTTRGIVGQVTSSAVVYDAETTSGGSGGPVLGPGGRVVAVNMGVMPEFGGSNLGVPIRLVRRLLSTTEGGG